MSLQGCCKNAGRVCINKTTCTAGQAVYCTGWPGLRQSWAWPTHCSEPLPHWSRSHELLQAEVALYVKGLIAFPACS